jgi:hypothetical protein
MGTLFIGILGGFSGTVGTVIGSSNRKGEDIIRVKSKKARTASTEGQISQQTRFSLVTAFLKPLNMFLKIGLRKAAGTVMSSNNYACQFALKNAIAGIAPDFEIDYGNVIISEGSLGQVKVVCAELTQGNVSFQWEDNSANNLGEPTDKAILIVYNVNNHELSYSIGQLTRSSAGGLLPVPNGNAGDQLLLYLFFQSATAPTLVSTSQYLGSVTMI